MATKTVPRRPQFRTHVVSFEDSEHKLIYKCPATELARDFVKGLPDKEKMNANYVEGKFEVASGVCDGLFVEYEYIPFPSVEEHIIKALRDYDGIRSKEWLRHFISRVLSLDLVECIPSEFLTLIVGVNTGWDQEVKCLRMGMIDLIPRNVLCHDDNWIIIDNEWSFSFPVPVWYVIFRAIYSIAVPFQREIRANASRRDPVRVLFKSHSKTYYVPVAWYELLGESDISMESAIHWERKFQQYVTGLNQNLGHEIPAAAKPRAGFVSSYLLPPVILRKKDILTQCKERLSNFVNSLKLKI